MFLYCACLEYSLESFFLLKVHIWKLRFEKVKNNYLLSIIKCYTESNCNANVELIQGNELWQVPKYAYLYGTKLTRNGGFQ